MSRLDADLQGVNQNGASAPASRRAAQLFLGQSFHRIRFFLSELTDNDDAELLATANSALGKAERSGSNGR